eukprot:TRINITY_DN16927_c0_g1_i1.p1 TRINITY_DN16927_c0_g1~~TRINITY_DN16927_c0_g1_i1.p1  ORF type:complete len:496 (-),score=110.06 TRINITY_DN16927_c0_g1_i1:37-1524(-)
MTSPPAPTPVATLDAAPVPEPQRDPTLLAAKAANYKAAIEGNKTNLLGDYHNRCMRYKLFDKHADEKGHKGEERQGAMQRFVDRERQAVLAGCKRWSTSDFESLQVLGEGSFGLVHLSRRRGTEEYYALKQMKKEACRRKNHRDGAFAERDLLAEAHSRWFVELFATFQDENHVYMVMEFLQGGDLIGHLMNKGRFTMKETQFYMAELLEALSTVHSHGFVHRDVKPDNMVLSSAGHLKLLDFGLCKHDPQAAEDAAEAVKEAQALAGAAVGNRRSPATATRTRRTELKTCVGTPQYMAPEVYRGRSGIEADIWSLGVITFECLVGHVPFHAGKLQGLEAIRRIKQCVLRSSEILPELLDKCVQKKGLPPMAAKFLKTVLDDDRTRRASAEQIRRDPFFFGIDFAHLHRTTPPIVPAVTGPGDAQHFDDFEPARLPNMQGAVKDTNLEWAHYEFDRTAYELQRPQLDPAAFFDKTAVNPRRTGGYPSVGQGTPAA